MMKYKRGTVKLDDGRIVPVYYPTDPFGLAIEHCKRSEWRILHINTVAWIGNKASGESRSIKSRRLAEFCLEEIRKLDMPWNEIKKHEDVKEWRKPHEAGLATMYRIIALVCKYQQPFDEVLEFTDKLMGGDNYVSQKNQTRVKP